LRKKRGGVRVALGKDVDGLVISADDPLAGTLGAFFFLSCAGQLLPNRSLFGTEELKT
jgi:hypothetical protein